MCARRCVCVCVRACDSLCHLKVLPIDKVWERNGNQWNGGNSRALPKVYPSNQDCPSPRRALPSPGRAWEGLGGPCRALAGPWEGSERQTRAKKRLHHHHEACNSTNIAHSPTRIQILHN